MAYIYTKGLYCALLAGVQNLKDNCKEINRINVFPVADGDTGDNMCYTLGEALENLACLEGLEGQSFLGSHRIWRLSVAEFIQQFADCCLESARGNSGLIVAQFFNGLAHSLAHSSASNLAHGGPAQQDLLLKDFARATEQACLSTYKALEQPQEGTILSVLRAWSEALNNGKPELDLKQAFATAQAAAELALSQTPQQLAVLAQQNCVDAAGLGFVSFLQGITNYLHHGLASELLRRELRLLYEAEPLPALQLEHAQHGAEPPEFRYCMQIAYINHKDSAEDTEEPLHSLRTMGNSLGLVQGRKRNSVHIHSSRPQEVVQVLRKCGKIQRLSTEDMLRQYQSLQHGAGRIAILTDSIADIPLELCDQYHIHVLPLRLLWGGEEELDRVTISPERFYREQQERTAMPSSSLPVEPKVEALYRQLLRSYDGVLVLSVAKALSGTYNLLKQVARKFPDTNIAVVDTKLNSVAQGLVVVKLAQLAQLTQAGKKLAELEAIAHDLITRTKILASVPTLRYMLRSGRLPQWKGTLARMTGLRPIVSLDSSGKGMAFSKAFSQRGLKHKIVQLVELWQQCYGLEEYAIVHAADPEAAQEFAGLLESATGKAPSYISEISPIVGMYSGQGALGLGSIFTKPF